MFDKIGAFLGVVAVGLGGFALFEARSPARVQATIPAEAFTGFLSDNPAIVEDAVKSYMTAHPSGATGPSGDAIRSYLLTNPGVIIEAVSVYEAQQKAAAAAADTDLITSNHEEIFNDGFSIVRGNPDGDITLVEFSDYNCGFCKKAHGEVEKFVKADGNIRLVIKELPILGQASVLAARAALASSKQDDGKMYPAFNDALITHRGSHTEATIMALATEVGLNVEQLKTDMESQDISDKINKTYSLAQKLRINGTPAFIIGDEVVRGFVPADRLKGLAEAARS